MNKLIKEAENLYKQIDKVQVHLVNARLNNDEKGKKSAISEMETAMCNAMQLLKCFIERKDNIVDLSEVWHYKDQEPPEIGKRFNQLGITDKTMTILLENIKKDENTETDIRVDKT